ncbi:hypothetical protein GCM10011610_56140 [Nocardia rhizosphaerihabitans]|uniref:Uncharacterized protein n=1 Tax=Nocardia rhizosphaerihabitans TaxID=1691570 RepID=A0ABQ2KUQ6_9NOCA|nr:hypothetical protein GCM10011610_56140 [Nocardia rhizosphaerihabitans]
MHCRTDLRFVRLTGMPDLLTDPDAHDAASAVLSAQPAGWAKTIPDVQVAQQFTGTAPRTICSSGRGPHVYWWWATAVGANSGDCCADRQAIPLSTMPAAR